MSTPNLGPSPAQVTMMGHNITAEIAARTARTQRRIRIGAVTAAVAAGVALTAAAIGVTAAPPEVRSSAFLCYLADDLSSDTAGIGPLDGGEPPTGETALIASAIEACEYAYGQFGVQAPAPTACELRDLKIAVFPNTRRLDAADLCTSLGLGVPPLD